MACMVTQSVLCIFLRLYVSLRMYMLSMDFVRFVLLIVYVICLKIKTSFYD